jgi:hypothetical protein
VLTIKGEQVETVEEAREGEAVNGSKRRGLSPSLFGAAMRDIKKASHKPGCGTQLSDSS